MRGLTSLGQVLAAATFIGGRTLERVSLTLAVHPSPAKYWSSDLGLSCNAAGDQAQVLAPNFTDTPPATIDVRPWLAWYTTATGWHWLGTTGVNESRWYQWTATPAGIAEWQTPTGGIMPWTWSPISVAPGHETYLVAVFEAIYWYEHPVYVWGYARSIEAGDASNAFCVYR